MITTVFGKEERAILREREIIKFIEPVYLFCLKRMNNRYDAEDLASEIMVHVLDGLEKYKIESLEAWVWRIAHNRYARWCKAKSIRTELFAGENPINLESDYDFVDSLSITDEYQNVFNCLHTLSSEYRNILVDYYIGELPVKRLSHKYSLPESTIKWRLNVCRNKIRERIGDRKMSKIYKRINWETTTCNGSMDTSAYLNNQVARAICEVAYEKPLSIEEISLKTGLPTMYIEDALPHLIYGDAIEQTGSKYATNFIILRLRDKERMEKEFAPLVGRIADYFGKQFMECENRVGNMGFFGHDFGMPRLGYIALPFALRDKVREIKNSLPGLANGPYPPRKDGGYGWFIVVESKDENDGSGEYNSGCNITDGENGFIYYYHTNKYFNNNIYHNGGTRWMMAKHIPPKCENGVIPDGLLSEDDIVRLLQANLIIKSGSLYKLNFACFSQEQFTGFSELFRLNNDTITQLLTNLIQSIHKSFTSFVPKRLDNQINQWVSCFTHTITGYVMEELIERNVLERPNAEKPLTSGVFYVGGAYLNI